MMNNNERKKDRRAYIIYRLERNVEIDMICNPGSEVEKRQIAKCVYQYQYDPSIYVFAVDFPDHNFLKEKNTVIFEITYNPRPLMSASYYSDRFTFELNDEQTHYFMIGLKFKRNERNMMFQDPPGEPIENSPEELLFFYYYLFCNYEYINQKLTKMGRLNEITGYLTTSFCQVSDLVTNFKISTNNLSSLLTNQKNITDYLSTLDEYILSHVRNKEIPEVNILLVPMFGIFSFDFFSTKDFQSKNFNLLLNLANVKVDHLKLIDPSLREKGFLSNGFYVLISLAIKEGSGQWLNLIKNKLHHLIFPSETEFFTKVNEIIRKCGTSMKVNEHFEEAKSYLMKFFIESTNPQIKSDSKVLNNLVRNISIIALSKENLIQAIFELNQEKLLDAEKLKIIKEEIKKKKWKIDYEDNYILNITRLKDLSCSLTDNLLKSELKNMIYEMSLSVKYIFALIKLMDFNVTVIDVPLLKKSFSSIYEISLEDYSVIIHNQSYLPESLKSDLFDYSFFDKIKQTLKRVTLPFEDLHRKYLPLLLLNQEFFPQPKGSLDFIKDFIKNKPNFEDLVFISRDLVYPQKPDNYLNNKIFVDTWLNIKNLLVNSSNDITELSRNFSILISAIQEKKISDLENFEINLSRNEFLNWLCEEIWRNINQKYSFEIFISISQLFEQVSLDDFKYNEIVISSYLKNVKNCIEAIKEDSHIYEKVNSFFSALCLPFKITDEIHEKVIYSNNQCTEIIISYMLDFLEKNSNMSSLFKLHILENPSKNSFWYKLIKSFGNFRSFLNHPYLSKVIDLIKAFFFEMKDGKRCIDDFIYLSKHDDLQKESLMSYFSKLTLDQSITLDQINEILSLQLTSLKDNLKIISDMESFFNNYSLYIERSEDYLSYIKELKSNFKIILFKDFTLREDILQIKSQVEAINKWNETLIFRNIFENEYPQAVNSLNNENIGKSNVEKILEICKTTQDQIKTILEQILLKEDFSQLSLTVTKKYFKGLEKFSHEADVLESMLNLQPTQKQILISILKTFCEINNLIKFCHSLLKLDSFYFFKNSNSLVYREFLNLINNTESTFDKIFTWSTKLTEIRTMYLEKRDIEALLYEISESRELTQFLLHTPEEDIRNMVDAVDEHGDSFIRVQTIRDLLIIGSFVKSLNLKDFSTTEDHMPLNPSEQEFIERIHMAFKRSSFTGIDVLLNSCSKQILGIKHLHNELSNREEASKIKAKEISKNSQFEFNFNQKLRIYEAIIKYGKSSKKINYRDLGDLRDRVLLLLYNEKDSTNESSNPLHDDTHVTLKNILFSFIKIVELSEKILFILNDIYHNGYPNDLSETILIHEGDYSHFENYLERISKLNFNWNEDMKEAYQKFYPLTYYNGIQFWELETFFEDFRKGDKPNTHYEQLPGYYLLKYSDPQLDLIEIRKRLEENLQKINKCKEDSEKNILDTTELTPKSRILNLGELISYVIDSNKNGSKQIENLRKVALNVKHNHIIYSFASNLRIYSYLISINFSLENCLPNSNQIFYCRRDTTFHELNSFLYRFSYSPISRVFSLIRMENLPFELQNYLVEQVNKYTKQKSLNAYLSLICCDPNSFLHSQFSESNNIFPVREFDVLDEILISQTLQSLNLNVYIVRSDDTGAGKTHYIRSKVNEEKMNYIDFPILDSIDINRINERLCKLNNNSLDGKLKFMHLTLSGIIDDYEMLDYILFSLLILGCIKHEINVSLRETINPVYLEIANTYNDYLYNSISILTLLPFNEIIRAEQNLQNLVVGKYIKDPVQIVANYLYNYDKEYLNDTDIVPDVEMNTKIYSKDDCLMYLQKYFIKDSHEVTFRQIQIFLSVLNDQLTKFSNNYFFSCENLGYINDDNLKDIRQRIMQCLLIMTEEFTTRSIKAARDSQNQTVFKLKRSFSREDINDEEKKIEELNSLSNILSWSSSNHMIIMFHEDGMCVTPVYREAAKVNEAVRELAESQRQDLEDYQVFSHFELLEKLLNIVGRQFELDNLAKKQDYILTADNFLKMLLIIIRARCNVPIVIMGETGCGKTSLVRFLASEIMQEGFEIINFHAGIKEEHIVEKMNEIISRAEILKVTENKVWIFLDEINTCDCMGLITELICQKTLLGKKLPDNIVFIAACNPYKIRRNLHNEVGLVKQRVATRLVYTVHPLPDALIDYVWDYGSLTDKEERLYIGNILNHISGEIKNISIDAVCKSQIFIRQSEDKYSVSLRDVARFKILHEWFYTTLMEKNKEYEQSNKKDEINLSGKLGSSQGYSQSSIKFTGKLWVSRKALILSVILCYYNRISKNVDRSEYKKLISNLLSINVEQLEEVINEEQKDLLNRMELPPAIAINKALLENVFTLMVCVINKIPLFICGKPGCSKSLSVQLLVSNLRGLDSHDNFFKKLPRILAIPYQGSETSTSEGIQKIFEKAHNVLNNNQDNSILPLIVFDEIGLAEISKNNPLKILHSLLEPEKAEIAFVGISNWRLDASKMNRAVFLARPDPDLEDLENTALSIFDYYNKEPRFDEKILMKALARTYFEFKELQTNRGFADFHGTRDFYSLIKGVTRELSSHYNNYNEVKFKIVKEALCRNFGGLAVSINNVLSIFSNCIKGGINDIYLQSSNVMELVKNNLCDQDPRFLLLFTNGESASYILDNYLKNNLKERVFMIGSEFEMDKDKDEHSFRLLSDIILYMESGNSIIVKNLDQIYGSLYDLFNQNFMIVGQKKNCRIALGSTNNPMCFVNDSFHCVVLVDIKDLHRMDPPFLNRFEKQILTFDSVLNERQKIIVNDLDAWIKCLTTIKKDQENESIINKNTISVLNPSDLITTYNQELAPSIVLSHFKENLSNEEILEKCKKDVLSVSSVSLIVFSVLSEMYDSSRDEVFKAHKIFFEEQDHESLDKYLHSRAGMTYSNSLESAQNRKLIVYTYSNILDEIKLSSNASKLTYVNIAEIKSEKEFDQRFKSYLNDESEYLLIKFDAQKENKHIPMIKFKVDKFLTEFKKIKPELKKNVIIIIYLSKSKRDSSKSEYKLESHFLSGWDQIMIDSINGGQIDELKEILNLSTIEIVRKNLDQKSIAEMIFNIYLKFSFETFNPNDMSLVKLYMAESIHKIENDQEIFNIIFKKCLEYLEDKDLGDWKLKICSDQKILSKCMNTFSAIKSLIESIVEEPLLRIIHYLESESALNSFFYTQNEQKSKIFKKIWLEQFDKKDLSSMYTYTVTQSLSVSCLFNLLFPFSKNDIYEISHALKDHIEKIYMYDNAAYNTYNSNSILEEELVTNFNNEIQSVNKIVRTSLLYKILTSNSEYNDRSIEKAYFSDVVSYFLLVEMKKEYKWKNCLDIIVQKFVGFEIENLDYMYIFLWENRKTLDSVFNIFNALCNSYSNSQALLSENYIESILSNDNLYDSNISLLGDLRYRKEAQINSFLNIFNIFSKIILAHLSSNKKNIKSNSYSSSFSYGIIINTFISSLMNFSLETKQTPQALNILIVVNEFLKIISEILRNDHEVISSRVEGLFDDDMISINQDEDIQILNKSSNLTNNQESSKKINVDVEEIEVVTVNTTNTKTTEKNSPYLNNQTLSVSSKLKNLKYDHINLKDFKFLEQILEIIDSERDILKKRQTNPENFIKLSFVTEIQNNIISAKLTIFENVILSNSDHHVLNMIVSNILKDEVLCQNSSMIFYHLFTHENPDLINNQPSTNSQCQILNTLLSSKLSHLINTFITSNSINMNSVVCSFFSDFFRKFLHSPSKQRIEGYLKDNFSNYENYLKLSEESNTPYDKLIGYAGLKHYLDLYGLYLADDALEKDFEIMSKINKSLESQEIFTEVLRNFTLKSMASFFGGTANTLVNIDYEKLQIHWVNNKLFENNDNALGIEPNLPEFEKFNKEYNLFFVSLLSEDSEENIQKLKNLILSSTDRPEMKFILIQFFINKVWLSFTHPKFLSSYTFQYILKIFDKVKSEIKSNLGEVILNFIYNLINNFPKNKNLCISPTTDTNRIGMLTLSMQMLNMLLSFKREVCIGKLYFDDKGQLCKNFNHWNSLFLPGGFVEYQDENLLVMMKHIDENYEIYGTQIGLYECMCGFLYTIGDCTRPYYVSQCPNCAKQIGGTGHVLMQGHKNLINADNRGEPNRKQWVIDYLRTKLRNNPGYVAKMADELSMHYSIRGLSSIGFRFFNFFNHSMIYLLTEFGAVEEQSLSSLINIKGINVNPKDYLIKHLSTDIVKLSDLIKSKEWYIFFHVVFNEFFTLNKDPFKFDSAIEREKFEIAFQTKIIQPKLNKLAGEITDYKLFFNNDKKLNYLSIINENFSEEEIKSLSNFEMFRIFRYTRLGYWDDLKNEFLKKKVPYQLVKLLVEKFDELTNLSECLHPIIQFNNYMLNLCNLRYTRAEAKEKKIRDVICNNKTAENLFIEFAQAWKRIAYKSTQWLCKSLPVLEKIDLDLPLSFILIDDRELGYGMYMAAAMQYLGSIQNEVLEAIVYLIKENNQYQLWGNMDGHKYPIQKIAPHEIIMYKTSKDTIHELTDTFSKFYDVFNPNYGQGAIVEYNFAKIEDELAFKLLTNKKFLDYENLNKIQYKFELLSIQGKHSNLLTDIKSKIEQVNLSEDELKECNKFLDKLESQNVAYLHEIFSSLEIVLCSLRYQNIIENYPIANYLAKVVNNQSSASQYQIFNLIKMSNILSLYQLVEERLFKYISEFISPEYNKPIESDLEQKIIDFFNLKPENPKLQSAKLVKKVIMRFIIRCLVATLEAKFPVKEYLMRVDFWDINTPEQIIDNFYFEFPDEILIAHTLSLYGILTEYIKSLGEIENELYRQGSLEDNSSKFDSLRQELFKKQNKFI